ncbi:MULTISPECIES: TIGR02594 family protein [Pseudomonadota]|uniref:TIGR02594 family protein n=1 Tax=Pseudomonadota TaxID=1224 RepID=UPI0026174C8B|nr:MULTISPECIES: TIGR02594 family protein [Pseudomonadota]
MTTPIDFAARMLGKGEAPDQAALQDYMRTGGVNLDPMTTAWCAAFVNATLAQTGQQGTGSNAAQSFKDWGEAVDQPERGDLAVFDRGGGKGHVGFFDGFNEDGTIRVLGGNQGDKVSVANFGTDNLIGYRRAPNAMLKGADFNPNAMIAAQEEPMLPDYQGINIGLAQLRGLQAQRRLYG